MQSAPSELYMCKRTPFFNIFTRSYIPFPIKEYPLPVHFYPRIDSLKGWISYEKTVSVTGYESFVWHNNAHRD